MKKNGLLVYGGIISILLVAATFIIPSDKSSITSGVSFQAARIMEESIGIISVYCRENNININEVNDPGLTGLIGPEMSDITTTIGHLEAKRTTLDPVFASLVTDLLTEAGVRRGDTIAMGCSGSFPGLLIASVSAVKAMNLNARIIISLGSSSYGANNPDFTILDIYRILMENDIIETGPAAVSLGGEMDRGEGFEGNIAEQLKIRILTSGIPFIYENDLQLNVSERESIYLGSHTRNISAFINTGGSYANMGTSALSLMLQPGRVGKVAIPGNKEKGVIFSMLEKGIPVIHMLNIRGVCQRYNLSWDPVSGQDSSGDEYPVRNSSHPAPAISIIFLAAFSIFLILYNRLNSINNYSF
ncbi:MAG TPA: poly-gamma-glutamate system protein [Bacteroidales bacterium]|nr:poly-gamma-glutamate system protein [Bacteroidales bacterium]